MNSSDLAAIIERLASKATPGPWRTGSPTFTCTMEHRHGEGQCKYQFRGWMDGEYWDKYIYRDKPMVDSGEEQLVAGTWSYEDGGIARREDAELIIELVNNLPAILDALRSSSTTAAREGKE